MKTLKLFHMGQELSQKTLLNDIKFDQETALVLKGLKQEEMECQDDFNSDDTEDVNLDDEEAVDP